MKNRLLIMLSMLGVFSFAQEEMRFSLEEAIQHTLTNNYDIVKADLEIKKAERRVWETTATGLPHIDGAVDYQNNIQMQKIFLMDTVFQAGQKQNFSPSIQINQLIFSGSYIVGLQSAKAYKEISGLAKEKTKAQLTEAVINAYAAVAIADENLAILEKNVASSEKNLNDIKEIYKAGFTEEQNVDQINYTLKQLMTSKNYAQRQRQSALNSLKFIMGVDQDARLVLTNNLDDLMMDHLALLRDDLKAEIDKHIDYQIANHQVKTSELQVKYQKTMALPSLSTYLSHSENWSTNEAALFKDFGNHFASTIWGIKLNVPIFSSFERRAKTQQAQIDLEMAEVDRKKTEQKLIQDVRNAEVAYDNAIESYYTSKDLVDLSSKILEKEQIKFNEGISSSMDLTNAEEQLYRAQNQYIQAAFDVMQSKTALYQALGQY
ncbi:TolC family protein [Weeksellaceae bacterium KMM 9724]|uniref:TolC family protein n=1 Tax=Profundicola chukchiensis TaxID=2961959 RepID=UPI00243E4F17|nr:TolC family protein [Profundicola chukchiensis]MDG4949903.1 TolC family protein [Profundicola chukchiensis]